MTRTVLAAAALAAFTLCAGLFGSDALASGAPGARSGELVVKYKPGTTSAERRRIRQAAGG